MVAFTYGSILNSSMIFIHVYLIYKICWNSKSQVFELLVHYGDSILNFN
jgi:hypothetical protein